MNTLATIPGIQPSPTGLTIDDELPYETWAEYGEALARAETGLTWAAGDWLAYGQDHWQGKAIQLASAVGLSERTLWNATSVCRRVPIDRRRPELSFGHHEAIAAQPEAIQAAWLQQAVDEGLSVHALRERVAEARPARELTDVGKPRRLPIRFNVTCPVDVPAEVLEEGVHFAAQHLHSWFAERGYDTDIAEVL